jgi:hypothetical protein
MCAARMVARVARILLVLMGVSLITMPVTQQMWIWDHFLHGGQDFELSMLLVLSFLCLTLVLAKHGKQYVDSWFVFWFAAWRLPSFESSDRMLARTPVAGASLILRTTRLGDLSLGLYSLPLQV